jgi:hypothetical protein
MDHAMIVGQVMHHCKRLIERVLDASDLQTVATASLAIVDQMREVARALLQAKVDLEAHKLRRQAVPPCCPGASLRLISVASIPPWQPKCPTGLPVISLPTSPGSS